MHTDPIRGKKIRWKFDDGPTAGKSFEHTFAEDGSLTFKMDGSADATRETHYETAKINDHVYSVSYLAKSGWTLTAILDFDSHEVTGVASNDKQLVVQHGHFS